MPIKQPGKLNVLVRIDEQLKLRVQVKLAQFRLEGIAMSMEQLVEKLLHEFLEANK